MQLKYLGKNNKQIDVDFRNYSRFLPDFPTPPSPSTTIL